MEAFVRFNRLTKREIKIPEDIVDTSKVEELENKIDQLNDEINKLKKKLADTERHDKEHVESFNKYKKVMTAIRDASRECLR